MTKKLYRSNRQRVIAGVCGGLAEYLDIDVVIIRLLWAAAVILGGSGILLYIIAALIIPARPREGAGEAEEIPENTGGRKLIFIIFVILAFLVLLKVAVMLIGLFAMFLPWQHMGW